MSKKKWTAPKMEVNEEATAPAEQPAEMSAVEEAAAPAPEKIEFEQWWAMRKNRIPAMHHREVVWADFKGRGMNVVETAEAFDAALKKYGIKI
jgi:hypothetical protein